MPVSSYYGRNHLIAFIIIEELYRLGVRDFIISPGARSAPLALACKEHKDITTKVILDERSAAFYALGIAKITRIPTVLLCTSGTAAAHYLPAIIEAYLTEVPLFILTADRPAELYFSGANQTVPQLDICASFVGAKRSIPAGHGFEEQLMALKETNWLYHECLKKPVHLNVQFRLPLFSEYRGNVVLAPRIARWLTVKTPLTQTIHPTPSKLPQNIVQILQTSRKGLIVAGPVQFYKEQAALRTFIDTVKWPCIAEFPSGITAKRDFVVSTLSHISNAESLDPDLVLHVGLLPTDNLTRQFLENSDACCLQINAISERLDPSGFVDFCVNGDLTTILPLFAPFVPSSTLIFEPTHSALNCLPASESFTFSELDACRAFLAALPTDIVVSIGNSLAIRLITMAGPTDQDFDNSFHRGASGIDGTIAIAAGILHATSRPTALLIGDLSFFHDISSLSLLTHSPTPCVIVVLNNNGGGIFRTLPSLSNLPHFSELFETPQSLSLERAAALFSIEYAMARSANELTSQIKHAYDRGQTTVVEALMS
jgi:2-succinyl-5-enolpyruvyl-6-hydroxy-3-cyclohexene-1-carboxylate synthase